MSIRKLLFLFLIFLATKTGSSQGLHRFNSFLFGVNDGMLQSSIRDIAFDKNNFCWVSYPNGIQRFDGVYFTGVSIQGGLPDDKWVFFQELPSGDLLISHSKGITLYESQTNQFKLVVKWSKPVLNPLMFLGYDEGVVYLIEDDGEVIGFNKTYKLVCRNRISTQEITRANIIFLIHPKIENHCIVGNINRKLYKWSLKEMNLVDESEDLGKYFLSYIGTGYKGDAFYCTYDSGGIFFYKYKFAEKKSQFLFFYQRKPVLPFRTNMFFWHGKQLISIYDKVFELDSLTFKLKVELSDFHRESFTNGGSINQFVSDRFENLFIQSVTTGICKVVYNNQSIRYFGNYNRKENFTLAVLADKPANRVLFGTLGTGLYIFDTAQQLIKHWSQFPGWPNPVSPNQIVRSPDGGYYILSFACPKIYYLSPDLSTLQSVKVNYDSTIKGHYSFYFGCVLYQDNGVAILQSQSDIFTINFLEQQVNVRPISGGDLISGLYRTPYIISYRSDSLVFFDASSLSLVKSVYFPNTGGVRCYLNAGDSCFFVGSNKGVFKVDSNGKILFHWDKLTGIPDECIYSMELDSQGGLWCGSNRGIFRIGSQRSILQLTSNDGLQENEFNSNASYKAQDGEMFFAGVNGVSSFYPLSILKRKDSLRTIFTNILINGIPVGKGLFSSNTQLDLPYFKNALSFDFLVMSAGNPSQYVYQYRMIGFDKKWIQNSGMQTVRYFLSPGKYKFQVYASRTFNQNAVAQGEIDIIINPPFWQTWWFIIMVSVFLLSIAGYVFNLIYRGRYEKQMLRLQTEQKVQKERERISRDLHDNIGAYASTVLYKAQIMENEEFDKKEILDDLKYASKEIITSLRETIWALKNENFTAQDCLIRIRNFVQSLNNLYKHIHFEVDGEAPQNLVVHSTKALNLVRIVQEVVTNAIKHSDCRQIKITSVIDLKNWELIIEDDGSGFDVGKEMGNEEGNGIKHMTDRAREAGMYFNLSSQPGRGTKVLLRLNIG